MTSRRLIHARLKSRAKLSGFTLIEVMLAMAIFSIAGVALLGAADTHFRTLALLETKMQANWVAANQLVEAKISREWPPKNNKKGKVELAGREWFWLQKSTKTTDSSMREIVIEIRMSEQQVSPESSLLTYVSSDTK